MTTDIEDEDRICVHEWRNVCVDDTGGTWSCKKCCANFTVTLPCEGPMPKTLQVVEKVAS